MTEDDTIARLRRWSWESAWEEWTKVEHNNGKHDQEFWKKIGWTPTEFLKQWKSLYPEVYTGTESRGPG